MIGSLNVVWPWKIVLETRINSKGIEEPFRYESVLPTNFEEESFVIGAIVLAIVGFGLIILLEKVSNKKQVA
jgi:putative membrane protein